MKTVNTYLSQSTLKFSVEEMLPNSFYVDKITLIPKSDKDNTQKRKKYRPIRLMNINVKILSKVSTNCFQYTAKESYIKIKWDLSKGCKDGSISANQSRDIEY